MRQRHRSFFVTISTTLALVLASSLPASQHVRTAGRDSAQASATADALAQALANPRVAPPPSCTPQGGTFTDGTNVAIADTSTISRDIVVSGVGQYLWDLDVRTFITHTFPDDLDITLTSPQGTVVTLTTDNAGTNDNVFNGTLWDDQAGATNPPGAVTDVAYASGVLESPVAPEESFAAFRGQNPNGTWTLTITDDSSPDAGTLNSWSLIVTAYAVPLLTTAAPDFVNTTPVPIPDSPAAPITSTIAVAGVATALNDLNVRTFIPHAYSGDLAVTLTSPAGTVVTLTTANGDANDNVFNGTTFDDQAGVLNPPGPVGDVTYANNVVEPFVAPEEPLAAFTGEDPNGTWTLTVEDNGAGDIGTLNSWALTLTTGQCGIPFDTLNFTDDDRASAVVVQPDGKIVVAGSWDGGSSDFALARYTPDNDLDETFGNLGRTNFTFAALPIPFGGAEFATALALQPDGKIIVVGYTDAGGGGGANNFAIARLKSDGSLDASFNGTGRVIVDFGFDDRATGVLVQPDGKIVVGGFDDGGLSNFALVRLNPNGTLDTTFNSTVPVTQSNGGGKLSFSFGGQDFATGVARDSVGRIIMVGYTTATGLGLNDFAIARVTPTGELDLGFDTDGKFTVDFGFDDRANGVAIQSGDRIVAVGADDGGSPDIAFVRLTPGGILDTTFNDVVAPTLANGDGRLSFTMGDNDFGRAIDIQPNGKIVFAGYSNSPFFPSPNNFVVGRITSAGDLDRTFVESGPLDGSGILGPRVFDFGGDDQAQAVAIRGDGVVVAAGFTRATPVAEANFALVQLGGIERTFSVQNIYPSAGLVSGGTQLTIDGTGFLPGVSVDLGGIPATNVTLVSATRLTATTPAHAAGAVTVTVTDPSFGPIFVPNGFTYLEPPASPATDTDGDGIPDSYELQFGTDPLDPNDGSYDWDQDGLTNLEEYTGSSHPRGFYTRYLAEGATGSFFDMRLALLNSSLTPSTTMLRYLKSDGTVVPQPLTINAQTRVTVDPELLAPLATAEFSTVVESDIPLVVDRTMTWDPNGYGSHAETSVAAPASTWYLAEGATHSGFNLFYLLQNPSGTDAPVEVTYLLPAPAAPLVRNYVVPANSRFNIWVDLIPELADTDVSAIIRSNADQPIIVERAMYLDSQGLLFGAGHESAGVTGPAVEWFLAEGATGSFFDLFVLIANPDPLAASITATFLLPDGSTVVKNYVVPGNSRFNIWVDLEGPQLADTAVSTKISASHGVIVERAMWWPGSSATWHEAHNSPGAISTGTRWALAEGEVTNDARALETYILLANTSAFAGTARVTLFFEDGTFITREFGMNPNSRTNVAVGIDFPEALNRRFGALVQSIGAPAAQIVVERAMYSNASGVVWAAGTNALATKLQ